jgi:ribosomal protein L11 methyltransferase
MNTTWVEVTCQVPTEKVEEVADFLVTLSGNGVCIENLNLDTFSLDSVEETPIKLVKTYFLADGFLNEKIESINVYLKEHLQSWDGLGPLPPLISYLEEEDWANNWKKHFRPSRVGIHLVIKPTWETYEAKKDDIIIELDPGMAFGTGTHPTSRLCLESIERITGGQFPSGEEKTARNIKLLDVGTGSGILAIAAARLGARQVLGIDVDPKAVEVAKQNIDLNGVEGAVTAETTSLNEITDKFLIVVANILAEDLVRMADDLYARVADEGFLILSGILTEKEDLVMDGFSRLPLSLVETTREGEWSCITYRLKR